MKKIIFSFTLFLVLAAVIFGPAKLSAQQAGVIQISPANSELRVNEEKIIKIALSEKNKISGFDLKFQTSGPIQITRFINELETNNNYNPFDLKQVKKSLNGSNSELSYIFNSPQSTLPETVIIYAGVKTSSAGQGKIAVDYQTSQILDGSGRQSTITPYSVSITAGTNTTSANFINSAALPKPVYPANTAFADLTLNLFGAINTSENLKAIAVAVGRIGDEKFETEPQEFELTPLGKGIFKGRVAFPDFRDGNKFSLMIKADKFLLKRICSLEAEKQVGAYQCTNPSLTIKKGENSFNFSGIALLPGDLGLADGFVNGYDLSLIRNNLGNSSASPTADVNLDGSVNKTDFDLVQFVLATTSGKGDQ